MPRTRPSSAAPSRRRRSGSTKVRTRPVTASASRSKAAATAVPMPAGPASNSAVAPSLVRSKRRRPASANPAMRAPGVVRGMQPAWRTSEQPPRPVQQGHQPQSQRHHSSTPHRHAQHHVRSASARRSRPITASRARSRERSPTVVARIAAEGSDAGARAGAAAPATVPLLPGHTDESTLLAGRSVSTTKAGFRVRPSSAHSSRLDHRTRTRERLRADVQASVARLDRAASARLRRPTPAQHAPQHRRYQQHPRPVGVVATVWKEGPDRSRAAVTAEGDEQPPRTMVRYEAVTADDDRTTPVSRVTLRRPASASVIRREHTSHDALPSQRQMTWLPPRAAGATPAPPQFHARSSRRHGASQRPASASPAVSRRHETAAPTQPFASAVMQGIPASPFDGTPEVRSGRGGDRGGADTQAAPKNARPHTAQRVRVGGGGGGGARAPLGREDLHDVTRGAAPTPGTVRRPVSAMPLLRHAPAAQTSPGVAHHTLRPASAGVVEAQSRHHARTSHRRGGHGGAPGVGIHEELPPSLLPDALWFHRYSWVPYSVLDMRYRGGVGVDVRGVHGGAQGGSMCLQWRATHSRSVRPHVVFSRHMGVQLTDAAIRRALFHVGPSLRALNLSGAHDALSSACLADIAGASALVVLSMASAVQSRSAPSPAYSAAHLTTLLRQSTRLTAIDISGNTQASEGTVAALRAAMPSVTTLDVSNVALWRAKPPRGLQTLRSVLLRGLALRHLKGCGLHWTLEAAHVRCCCVQSRCSIA